jgi:DNA-binding PadR family transcriptional regulator
MGHQSFGRPTRRRQPFNLTTDDAERFGPALGHFAAHAHAHGHAGDHIWTGRGGSRGRGGGRGRRGDVRAAILALLAERPMHGYEMLQELAQRTNGLWRPSPGSLYPALQLLEDEGLVQSVTADGRRRYELTDAGRAELAARPAAPTPWDTIVGAADSGEVSLHSALRHLVVAVGQVAEAGSASQKADAERLLSDVRRQVYLLLAEAPTEDA